VSRTALFQNGFHMAAVAEGGLSGQKDTFEFVG
jgi:hypothetical protein